VIAMKLSELLVGVSASARAEASRCGLHVVQTDESTLCDRALAMITSAPKGAVRTIRGRKSRSLASFFDESAAALQFPYYFGENWNAFDEVVNDLSWLPAEAYVLLFSSADQLLHDAPGADFRILVETLSEVHAAYAKGPGLRFHAVFQCATPEAIADFSARLRASNVAFDEIDAG
jgi:hypothetical protein